LLFNFHWPAPAAINPSCRLTAGCHCDFGSKANRTDRHQGGADGHSLTNSEPPCNSPPC
jgi:hypothetical protein